MTYDGGATTRDSPGAPLLGSDVSQAAVAQAARLAKIQGLVPAAQSGTLSAAQIQKMIQWLSKYTIADASADT
jgi:hypothetical protein